MAYSGQPPQTGDTLRLVGLILGVVLLAVGVLGLVFISVGIGVMGGMMSGMMGGSTMGGAGMMTGMAAPCLVVFAIIAVMGLGLALVTARR